MKINVNIINRLCITISEAVTVPTLMMTLIVSEESLARDRQTHTRARAHTHTHAHGFDCLPKSLL